MDIWFFRINDFIINIYVSGSFIKKKYDNR